MGPADRIEDLNAAREVGPHAGDTIGLIEVRHVARGIGSRVRGLRRVEISAHLHPGCCGRRAIDETDIDGIKLINVDDLIVVIEAPALQVETGGVAKIAKKVGLETSGTGIELVTSSIGKVADNKETAAGNRNIGC